MRLTRFDRFAAVCVATLVLSCSDEPTGDGGGGGGGGGPVQTTSVDVRDNLFSPDAIAISTGQTVTWTWQGNDAHNVTFDDASITGSGNRSSGTFQRTFDTPGTYTYSCTLHPPSMDGSIVVQ